MYKRLCILAPSVDVHAFNIAERVKETTDLELNWWCTSTLGSKSCFEYQPKTSQLIVKPQDGKAFSLDRETVVWWRRPLSPVENNALAPEPMRRFAAKENVTSFAGAMLACAGKVSNHPSAERTANHKTYQLSLANRVGLNVPETLVTSDPEVARNFIAKATDTLIYKVHHPPQQRMIDARIVSKESLDAIDTLKYSPIIFQQYIDNATEVRALVLNHRVLSYAARVDVDAPKSVDIRLQEKLTWSKISLSPQLEAQLQSLLLALKLESGVVDGRLDDEGIFWFLECNPSGQFLFMDEVSDELTDAFVENLISD